MKRSILASRDAPLGLRDIFLLIPDRAEGIVRYYESVMRGPSDLSPAERELIYAYCSRLNGCHFAYTSHSTCAIDLGMPPGVFDALMADIDRAEIRDALKPLVRFVRKLTLTPSAIEPADAVPVYEAGLSEQALASAIEVCALVGFINRVLDGFCAWAPDETHRENGHRLARDGYIPVAEAVRRSIEAHRVEAHGNQAQGNQAQGNQAQRADATEQGSRP